LRGEKNASSVSSADISDEARDVLEPNLPGRKGTWSGNARDDRQFINGVFWILRTGAPWMDLPPEYGNWKNTHRRFCRWRDKGVWEHVLEKLINEPDFEWLMIDASHIKAHPHAAGAVGGNQDMGRTKGGSIPNCIWPWMRMACQSEHLLRQVPLLIANMAAN
jgi:transposase